MVLAPFAALFVAQAGSPLLTVPPPRDPDALGRGVQRTMRLLATSTPERRNRVRILVYGQSISEQDWWKGVADDLRRRFPHADLEVQNRAIGGFASQRLKLPMVHDVIPYYPDLLIFHVYGSHVDYETIIRTVRSQTAAEVLMQKDHAAGWPDPEATQESNRGMWWDRMMNDTFLPDIAKRYGCGLVDVRSGWLDYMKANRLEPRALLIDGIHLNDHGNSLMAELIKRYLVVRPELPKEGPELVRDVPVSARSWRRGRLTLTFEGNRVDIVPASPGGGRLAVRIDGRKPSTFPSLYAITRPTPNPWSPLALVRVDHTAPLKVEDWTLTVTKTNADATKWSYRVAGSVTGDDGEGTSDAPFTSRSGRVRIDPDSFHRAGKFDPGYEIKWQVVPMHRDEYQVPAPLGTGMEGAVTVAQGLPNGRHRLELTAIGGKPPALRAIRVYRPPFPNGSAGGS